MTYDESLKFLRSLTDMERDPALSLAAVNFELGRMESLLLRVGSPHGGRRTVHVAGSKGKGSTASMIGAILGQAGETVGLYTSPHLHRYEERIAINGRAVDRETFARLAELVKPAVEAESREGDHGAPSTFEALTAMAFLAFSEHDCSWQVLEVGLGGRLDATNVEMLEKISVITPVGLEHTAILGDSIAKIAAEKAGIVRGPGIVVMAPQRQSAVEVIRARCAEVGANLVEVADQVKLRLSTASEDGREATIATRRSRYELKLPLISKQQAHNAATAVVAAELIFPGLTSAMVRGALENLKLPGRQELIRRRPWIMVDVAHSEDSVRSLVETLRELHIDDIVLVFAPLSDKRLPEMATLLAPLSRQVVASAAPHPRAAPLDAIVGAFRPENAEVLQVADFEEALALGRDLAGDRSRLVVAGSFAAAAAARQYFLALSPVPEKGKG